MNFLIFKLKKNILFKRKFIHRFNEIFFIKDSFRSIKNTNYYFIFFLKKTIDSFQHPKLKICYQQSSHRLILILVLQMRVDSMIIHREDYNHISTNLISMIL